MSASVSPHFYYFLFHYSHYSQHKLIYYYGFHLNFPNDKKGCCIGFHVFILTIWRLSIQSVSPPPFWQCWAWTQVCTCKADALPWLMPPASLPIFKSNQFFIVVVLGFELRALCLVGTCSTTWILFFFVVVIVVVFCFVVL
jgi:hypothetical protein